MNSARATPSARGDNANEMGDNLPAIDLGTGRTAVAIDAAFTHNSALLDDASVKCWGQNVSGELGYGDTVNRGDDPGEMGDNLPAINLGTGRTATAISAGYDYTCAVLDNATAKCWGNNADGELGQGDTTNRGDNAGQMGDNLTAISLGTGRTAVSIVTGLGIASRHTCALLDNAAVKCWGHNSSGELGQGNTTVLGDGAGEMGDNLPAVDFGAGGVVAAVAGGNAHSSALLLDGSVKCWGRNAEGQLGLGNTIPHGDNTSGGHLMGTNLPTVDLGTGRTALTIAATPSGDSTCALLDNHTVKCWGYNADGELGQGNTTPPRRQQLRRPSDGRQPPCHRPRYRPHRDRHHHGHQLRVRDPRQRIGQVLGPEPAWSTRSGQHDHSGRRRRRDGRQPPRYRPRHRPHRHRDHRGRHVGVRDPRQREREVLGPGTVARPRDAQRSR